MTAEVMTEQNNRKFIPVLRSGSWHEAAPSWLAGKYYIDLSADPYCEQAYGDLIRTLLGKRETAPPIGQPMSTVNRNTTKQPETAHRSRSRIQDFEDVFEDVKITHVIEEDITEPRNDGTPGSALYAVPFALSCRPSAEWAELFIENWNHPPRFTTMHRPGIARIYDATVILDGTTIDEVKKYHRDTLQLAVKETNRQYGELQHNRRQAHARRQALHEDHQKRVAGVSREIKFD